MLVDGASGGLDAGLGPATAAPRPPAAVPPAFLGLPAPPFSGPLPPGVATAAEAGAAQPVSALLSLRPSPGQPAAAAMDVDGQEPGALAAADDLAGTRAPLTGATRPRPPLAPPPAAARTAPLGASTASTRVPDAKRRQLGLASIDMPPLPPAANDDVGDDFVSCYGDDDDDDDEDEEHVDAAASPLGEEAGAEGPGPLPRLLAALAVPSGGGGARAAAVASLLAHVSPAARRLLLAQPDAVPLGPLVRLLLVLASVLHELRRTAAARGGGAPWMSGAPVLTYGMRPVRSALCAFLVRSALCAFLACDVDDTPWPFRGCRHHGRLICKAWHCCLPADLQRLSDHRSVPVLK